MKKSRSLRLERTPRGGLLWNRRYNKPLRGSQLRVRETEYD